MLRNDWKDIADEAVLRYNQPHFIEDDPILIPHLFSKKEDIEIAGFFSATIAWGQRKTILANARKLTQLMDNAPHDFILNHSDEDLKPFVGFVHRTFQTDDLLYFIHSLKNIYSTYGGLEGIFTKGFAETQQMNSAVSFARNIFFNQEHLKRTQKHFSDPLNGSAAKRIHMYLRWMVRKDNAGVDFGLWNNIPSSALMPPLDVHSGRVARNWKLLHRHLDDRKAVEELQSALKNWDDVDPIKYDFALYGLGVHEGYFK